MNKNIVIIVIGFIVLIIAAICPLPMILGISGIAWRLIIGLLGCFSLVLGIYKMSSNR